MPRHRLKRTQEPNTNHLLRNRMERNRKRILVVDDDMFIREVLSRVLSIMGLEVAVAGSGSEGLNLFLMNSFDLVLTDLQMPGLDGFDLADHIKEESPETPVVLLTGQEKLTIMDKIEGSCVDAVMFKPFELEDVTKTVKNCLENKA